MTEPLTELEAQRVFFFRKPSKVCVTLTPSEVVMVPDLVGGDVRGVEDVLVGRGDVGERVVGRGETPVMVVVLGDDVVARPLGSIDRRDLAVAVVRVRGRKRRKLGVVAVVVDDTCGGV